MQDLQAWFQCRKKSCGYTIFLANQNSWFSSLPPLRAESPQSGRPFILSSLFSPFFHLPSGPCPPSLPPLPSPPLRRLSQCGGHVFPRRPPPPSRTERVLLSAEAIHAGYHATYFVPSPGRGGDFFLLPALRTTPPAFTCFLGEQGRVVPWRARRLSRHTCRLCFAFHVCKKW